MGACAEFPAFPPLVQGLVHEYLLSLFYAGLPSPPRTPSSTVQQYGRDSVTLTVQWQPPQYDGGAPVNYTITVSPGLSAVTTMQWNKCSSHCTLQCDTHCQYCCHQLQWQQQCCHGDHTCHRYISILMEIPKQECTCMAIGNGVAGKARVPYHFIEYS